MVRYVLGIEWLVNGLFAVALKGAGRRTGIFFIGNGRPACSIVSSSGLQFVRGVAMIMRYS